MNAQLSSHDDIVEALRSRMRVGEGLSVPYARKWSIGGCEASHSLWSYPHDSISDFAEGLLKRGLHATAAKHAIEVHSGAATLWIAVNGKSRTADRPSEFLVGCDAADSPVVVVNSPEVALEIVQAYVGTAEAFQPTEIVQIGFPGIYDKSRTYVGSWQWNVHGEARGDEFVRRTADATLAAIRAREAERGD